jgi:hypothetical protein
MMAHHLSLKDGGGNRPIAYFMLLAKTYGQSQMFRGIHSERVWETKPKILEFIKFGDLLDLTIVQESWKPTNSDLLAEYFVNDSNQITPEPVDR